LILIKNFNEAKPQTDKRVWNYRLHRLYELVFLSVKSVVSVVIFKNLTHL